MEHIRVILFKAKILEEAILKIRYTLHVLKWLSRSVILKTLSRPTTNLLELVLIHQPSILTANSISFFFYCQVKNFTHLVYSHVEQPGSYPET